MQQRKTGSANFMVPSTADNSSGLVDELQTHLPDFVLSR